MRTLLLLLAIWSVLLCLKAFHPPSRSNDNAAPRVQASVKPVPDPHVPNSKRQAGHTPLPNNNPAAPPAQAYAEPVHDPQAPDVEQQTAFEIEIPLPADNSVVSRKHMWNTLGVSGHDLKTGEVAFQIAMEDLNQQIASYGIPEDRLGFRYLPGDLERVQRIRDQAFAKRGILSVNNRLKPDYPWMIRQSQKYTYPVARSLLASFQKKSGKSREFVSYVASYVQNLEYRIPDSPRGLPWNPNQKMVTCGVNMPLETLYNGWGDCDSKSVLLAALFANLGKTSTVFVEGKDHVFIGVAGAPTRNDHFVMYRNIKYILIETTRPWPVGKIPKKSLQGMVAKQFKIYQVH